MMKRSLSPLKFFALFYLLYTSFCLPASNLTANTTSNFKSPSSTIFSKSSSQYIARQIDITKPQNYVFTVEADFALIDSSSPVQSFLNAQMILGLYTSYGIFGGPCQGFISQECSDFPTCQLFPNTAINISLPYSSIQGVSAQASVSIDSNSFYNPHMPFIYPSTCSGNLPLGPGQDQVYGVIGMGIAKVSNLNYHPAYPIFSIYLEPDSSYGKLIFSIDSSHIDDSYPALSLPASEDWEITFTKASIVIDNRTTEFNGTVIFDLNLSYIALPASLYENITQWLITKCNVQCTELITTKASTDTLRPMTCVIDGDYMSLPSITITSQHGNLSIPPEVYMQNNITSSGESVYILKLVRLLENEQNAKEYEGGYLEVGQEFGNYIILGAPFMAHYYVGFESYSSGQAVHVYKASKGSETLWLLILVGFGLCTLVLFIIIIILFFRRKDTTDEMRSNTGEHSSEYAEIVGQEEGL